MIDAESSLGLGLLNFRTHMDTISRREARQEFETYFP